MVPTGEGTRATSLRVVLDAREDRQVPDAFTHAEATSEQEMLPTRSPEGRSFGEEAH
jgi:hypothetical protein